jgi:outer membrane lipoprotein-sorting protein
MKKLFSLSLVVGIFVATMSIAPASGTSGQTAGMVSSILNRMQRFQRSLKTLRADITMEKYNSQLREKEMWSGIVLYIPAATGSASVRLEWNRPQHEILTSENGNYTLYRPRLGIAYVGPTGAIKNQNDSSVLALMNMSATQLRTKFGEFQDTREETLWGGVATWHFKVFPKVAASYKYIEVWVDNEGMPVQTKMVEKNDDATTVRLTNVARNQTIPMDQFKQNLDASVKRVKG